MQLIVFIDQQKFGRLIDSSKHTRLSNLYSQKNKNPTTGKVTVEYFNATDKGSKKSIICVDARGNAESVVFEQSHAEDSPILIIPDQTKIHYSPTHEFIILRHTAEPDPDTLKKMLDTGKFLRIFFGSEEFSKNPKVQNRYPELLHFLRDDNRETFEQFIMKTFPDWNQKLETCLNNLHESTITPNHEWLKGLGSELLELLQYGFKSSKEIQDGILQISQLIKPTDKNPFKACFIWDTESNTTGLNILESKFIKCQKEFEKANFMLYDQIYVLAELKWDDNCRSEFKGFTLAKELRKKKIPCPIIICSFASDLNYKYYPDAKILKTPGHYFLHLPGQPDNSSDLKALDKDTLEDINIHLSNPDQTIHDLFHNTFDIIASVVCNENERSKKKELAKEYISKPLEAFKESVEFDQISRFEEIKKNILDKIEDTIDNEGYTDDHLRDILRLFKGELYSLLPKDLADSEQIQHNNKNWQVLYIDDVAYNRKTVSDNFDRNDICCHTCSNAEDAFSILKQDENHEKRILVVISDFRLYVDGNDQGDWQDIQGYKLLKQIAFDKDFKSHYVYVMLTSKEGTIKHYIKKQSDFSVLWFHKGDVLGGTPHSFDVFCRQIIEVGNDAYLRKFSIPTLGGWGNTLQGRMPAGINYSYFYKLHIEDINYHIEEFEINRKAVEILKNIEIPKGYTLQPSFNKNEKIALKTFRDSILLYRRIFFKLKFIDKKDDKQILRFFSPEYNDVRDESDTKGYINTLFLSNWGFQLNLDNSDIKDENYLHEELTFLNKNYPNNSVSKTNDRLFLNAFFNEIVSFNWSTSTKEMISSMGITILQTDSNIPYTELASLFSQLNNERFKNPEIDDLVMETELMKSYMNQSDMLISDRLLEIIENF